MIKSSQHGDKVTSCGEKLHHVINAKIKKKKMNAHANAMSAMSKKILQVHACVDARNAMILRKKK